MRSLWSHRKKTKAFELHYWDYVFGMTINTLNLLSRLCDVYKIHITQNDRLGDESQYLGSTINWDMNHKCAKLLSVIQNTGNAKPDGFIDIYVMVLTVHMATKTIEYVPIFFWKSKADEFMGYRYFGSDEYSVDKMAILCTPLWHWMSSP